MTGGFDGSGGGGNSALTSTELLVKGATKWNIYAESLPGRNGNLASISFSNEVFVSGKRRF